LTDLFYDIYKVTNEYDRSNYITCEKKERLWEVKNYLQH
jgi:hypothetical protein